MAPRDAKHLRSAVFIRHERLYKQELKLYKENYIYKENVAYFTDDLPNMLYTRAILYINDFLNLGPIVNYSVKYSAGVCGQA